MGNIDFSKMGLSGKMGSIVAYTVNGKQRFRSYAEPKNPKTPKQIAQRSRFGFVSKKVSPLFNQIKIGYRDQKIVFSSICGKVNREAVIGEYPNLRLDYSKIQFAQGKLPPPEMVKVHIDENTNTANFEWDGGPANENVSIVCFNEAMPCEIFRKGTSQRKESKATIELPKHWNIQETHFWLYLTSYDRRFNSDSVYIFKNT